LIGWKKAGPQKKPVLFYTCTVHWVIKSKAKHKQLKSFMYVYRGSDRNFVWGYEVKKVFIAFGPDVLGSEK